MVEKKVIAVCGSMAFAQQMVEVGQFLEGHGYEVILPRNTEKHASGEMKDVGGSEGADRKVAGDLIREYGAIIEKIANVLVVVNGKKAGLDNYIGGNSFAEMVVAHCHHKPIVILNAMPEQNERTKIIWQEIYAIVQDDFETLRLDGDLALLPAAIETLVSQVQLLKETKAAKSCDHTSVGMLVQKDIDGDTKLLLIERKKPPFGFAPPAGHVDEHGSFEKAAFNELREEVGLEARDLQLVAAAKKNNPCRRKNGDWHYWRIYEARDVVGEIKRSEDETKQAGWFDHDQVHKLTQRTEAYLRGEIPEDEWQKSPGLEPVWLEWLRELCIIFP